MNEPLTEAQLEDLRGLPTALPDDVFKFGDNSDHLREPIASYLKDHFFKPEEGFKCRGCGLPLGGLLGSFAWGIAHGEGFCSQCQMPVRMYHRIKDSEGKEILSFTLPLQYHASGLSMREKS